ncbi:MAG: ATP-binding protein [Sulfuricurvum sp.]|uniref:ATP-binding protein n=1 Tax=Sulfuricurvum sp. TaxID=2025608 RepID=UPI00261EBD88|nr:ATP-binding protein [Sulfuricurvum sp.]MDD2828939.1 ATP-binding protein [Sulfuricurvum sp.]MDD4950038.1 ATP-binding protein [Sulfuricurvum sp.]
MLKSIRIVYVSDWAISDQELLDQDPFLKVLNECHAEVTIRSNFPESFTQIDLLILHPMQMNLEIFEVISKSKLSNPAIKTVVISSAHGSDLFLRAIDVGVDKYLLKPLLPSAVQKVVERLTHQSIEAKNAQKAYKQINLMFGAISKTALVIRIRKNGMISEVNSLLSLLVGLESTAMVDHYWLRFVERRFWIYLRTLVRARLEAGEIYRGIIELIGKEKQTITVDSTIYAVLDGYNRIEEIVFIGHDVSEMKRAILESMKQLIDYDTSLAVLFDHNYEAIMANKKFLKANNYKSFDELIHSCDLCSWMVETNEGLEPILSTQCSQKESLEFIVKKIKKGHIQGRIISIGVNNIKTYYTVHMSSMSNPLIQNEHYHILYFVDVSDIERHKEDKINDAKLMSVGRLAAAITHEINTPVTYIKGNLELLKWECEDKISDAEELFRPIDEGISRIESIVKSMYEFAGTGKEEIQPFNVHMTLIYALRIILNRAKHIVTIRINGEAFNLSTQYDPLSCKTMGISTRLEQVWIIIINNALDEFEKGEIPYEDREINITLNYNEDDIVVKLADNAGGIPESILNGIFDFAVSGVKKQSMGIGLNVAKAIIDKHGGAIYVNNEKQGAVFEIHLKKFKGES